jgi:phage gp36-like protein
MAYLIKDDLHTHLYPEVIDEIIRKAIKEYDSADDFPEEGVSGYIYQDNSIVDEEEENQFVWSGTSYIPATDPDLIVTRAINSAIAEVKSYLSRFDLLKLFGNSETEAVTVDEHLKNKVKDVASWHLVKLANPNVDIKMFRTLYEDAIKWFEKVMKGQADPEGWPYKEDDTSTPGDESSGVQWSSNKKRKQHF